MNRFQNIPSEEVIVTDTHGRREIEFDGYKYICINEKISSDVGFFNVYKCSIENCGIMIREECDEDGNSDETPNFHVSSGRHVHQNQQTPRKIFSPSIQRKIFPNIHPIDRVEPYQVTKGCIASLFINPPPHPEEKITSIEIFLIDQNDNDVKPLIVETHSSVKGNIVQLEVKFKIPESDGFEGFIDIIVKMKSDMIKNKYVVRRNMVFSYAEREIGVEECPPHNFGHSKDETTKASISKDGSVLGYDQSNFHLVEMFYSLTNVAYFRKLGKECLESSNDPNHNEPNFVYLLESPRKGSMKMRLEETEKFGEHDDDSLTETSITTKSESTSEGEKSDCGQAENQGEFDEEEEQHIKSSDTTRNDSIEEEEEEASCLHINSEEDDIIKEIESEELENTSFEENDSESVGEEEITPEQIIPEEVQKEEENPSKVEEEKNEVEKELSASKSIEFATPQEQRIRMEYPKFEESQAEEQVGGERKNDDVKDTEYNLFESEEEEGGAEESINLQQIEPSQIDEVEDDEVELPHLFSLEEEIIELKNEEDSLVGSIPNGEVVAKKEAIIKVEGEFDGSEENSITPVFEESSSSCMGAVVEKSEEGLGEKPEEISKSEILRVEKDDDIEYESNKPDECDEEVVFLDSDEEKLEEDLEEEVKKNEDYSDNEEMGEWESDEDDKSIGEEEQQQEEDEVEVDTSRTEDSSDSFEDFYIDSEEEKIEEIEEVEKSSTEDEENIINLTYPFEEEEKIEAPQSLVDVSSIVIFKEEEEKEKIEEISEVPSVEEENCKDELEFSQIGQGDTLEGENDSKEELTSQDTKSKDCENEGSSGSNFDSDVDDAYSTLPPYPKILTEEEFNLERKKLEEEFQVELAQKDQENETLKSEIEVRESKLQDMESEFNKLETQIFENEKQITDLKTSIEGKERVIEEISQKFEEKLKLSAQAKDKAIEEERKVLTRKFEDELRRSVQEKNQQIEKQKLELNQRIEELKTSTRERYEVEKAELASFNEEKFSNFERERERETENQQKMMEGKFEVEKAELAKLFEEKISNLESERRREIEEQRKSMEDEFELEKIELVRVFESKVSKLEEEKEEEIEEERKTFEMKISRSLEEEIFQKYEAKREEFQRKSEEEYAQKMEKEIQKLSEENESKMNQLLQQKEEEKEKFQRSQQQHFTTRSNELKKGYEDVIFVLESENKVMKDEIFTMEKIEAERKVHASEERRKMMDHYTKIIENFQASIERKEVRMDGQMNNISTLQTRIEQLNLRNLNQTEESRKQQKVEEELKEYVKRIEEEHKNEIGEILKQKEEEVKEKLREVNEIVFEKENLIEDLKAKQEEGSMKNELETLNLREQISLLREKIETVKFENMIENEKTMNRMDEEKVRREKSVEEKRKRMMTCVREETSRIIVEKQRLSRLMENHRREERFLQLGRTGQTINTLRNQVRTMELDRDGQVEYLRSRESKLREMEDNELRERHRWLILQEINNRRKEESEFMKISQLMTLHIREEKRFEMTYIIPPLRKLLEMKENMKDLEQKRIQVEEKRLNEWFIQPMLQEQREYEEIIPVETTKKKKRGRKSPQKKNMRNIVKGRSSPLNNKKNDKNTPTKEQRRPWNSNTPTSQEKKRGSNKLSINSIKRRRRRRRKKKIRKGMETSSSSNKNSISSPQKQQEQEHEEELRLKKTSKKSQDFVSKVMKRLETKSREYKDFGSILFLSDDDGEEEVEEKEESEEFEEVDKSISLDQSSVKEEINKLDLSAVEMTPRIHRRRVNNNNNNNNDNNNDDENEELNNDLLSAKDRNLSIPSKSPRIMRRRRHQEDDSGNTDGGVDIWDYYKPSKYHSRKIDSSSISFSFSKADRFVPSRLAVDDWFWDGIGDKNN